MNFDFSQVAIDTALALKVPMPIAKRNSAIVFAHVQGVIHIAASEDTAGEVKYSLLRYLPEHDSISVEIVETETIKNSLNKVYGKRVNRDGGLTEESTAVRMVRELLSSAIINKASDIHLEPSDASSRCRMRVDGSMQSHSQYDSTDHHQMVSRIKVLADLNISERKLPQDGKFSFYSELQSRSIDIRVASIPTKHGEKITLRLIGAMELPDKLESLGFDKKSVKSIHENLKIAQGLVLVTGPTGSGKSTTLYSFLKHLRKSEDLSLISLEDPVEYEMAGVTQVGIDHQRTSFSRALRSALRHDPDVILVGEIRDAETASIAVRAALTGHLVLSTLHTNSAVTVPQRLVDMGVPAYLVASTLNLVISQRLVKKLCKYCQKETDATSYGRSYKTDGCKYCMGSGYAGRAAVYEIMEIDNTIRRMVVSGQSEIDLHGYLQKNKVRSLWQEGKKKVNEGVIDAESAERVIGRVDGLTQL